MIMETRLCVLDAPTRKIAGITSPYGAARPTRETRMAGDD